ncbi:hypothetical protein GO013_07315 [Pseudodesulfovibrio sp. JC047]|nr:hypothetical protein [Pseudodesulfovibrio sp. JC047]
MSPFEMLVSGGAALAGVASTAMSMTGSEVKAPKVSAAPDRSTAATAQQAKDQRRRLLNKQGKDSLQDTFALGDTSAPSVMTRTLLGGR